jgi:thioredoxin 1
MRATVSALKSMIGFIQPPQSRLKEAEAPSGGSGLHEVKSVGAVISGSIAATAVLRGTPVDGPDALAAHAYTGPLPLHDDESMTSSYFLEAPERADVDAWKGPAVLEFGASWCGICAAAQPDITEAFAGHEDIRHVKIEDGPGKPLGRSYRVKLWPTLVFLQDGQEVAKLVRPTNAEVIREALARIATKA